MSLISFRCDDEIHLLSTSDLKNTWDSSPIIFFNYYIIILVAFFCIYHHSNKRVNLNELMNLLAVLRKNAKEACGSYMGTLPVRLNAGGKERIPWMIFFLFLSWRAGYSVGYLLFFLKVRVFCRAFVVFYPAGQSTL